MYMYTASPFATPCTILTSNLEIMKFTNLADGFIVFFLNKYSESIQCQRNVTTKIKHCIHYTLSTIGTALQ